MQNVVCPHCGKEVELTEAFRHEVEERISKELKASQKEQLEKVKRETEDLLAKRFAEENSFRVKNYENELEELRKSKKETENKYLEMMREIRELRESNDKTRIENERKLNEQIEKIKNEEDQKGKLEKMELQKKLDDMQKSLEEAQRKSVQGSQQLQGEVLELDLEKQLQLSFPEDEILPVPKGISGGDVLQKVRNKIGREAGTIIWEAKRAKWQPVWLSKLKEDMRSANASEAILVVENLPEKLQNSGLVNGIWVTSYRDALTVATTIRLLLMKVAAAKSAAENKDEKLEDLYQYITSDNFRHKIESQLESFIELKADLDSEKRSMEKNWAKRETQLLRLERNTSKIFGELQGIAGPALPSIKLLDGPETENEQEELPL